MVEFAPLDFYKESDPTTLIVNIPSVGGANSPSDDVQLYQTQDDYLWRVRLFAVHGRLTGTAGTAQLTLSFQISAAANLPWTNSANDSGINATSPQDITHGENFAYTWSTEIGDNYVGTNFQWGKTAMLGLPLAFIPGSTFIDLEMTGSAGFDGFLIIRDGYMLIEKWPKSGTTTDQAGFGQTYLLPAVP